MERKKVKNINFRIDSEGRLLVSAPYYIKEEYIIDAIERNSAPILRILSSMENKRHFSLDSLQYKEGEVIYFWGKETPVSYSCNSSKSCFKDGIIYIKVMEKAGQKEKKEALLSFLSHEVECFMKEASEKLFYEYFTELNEMPAIVFKNLKSRWGSCCKAKNLITYNRNLVFLPKEFAFYVAVHEFCHLRVFDHSKAFYNEVAKIMPEYKKVRDIAKEYAP